MTEANTEFDLNEFDIDLTDEFEDDDFAPLPFDGEIVISQFEPGTYGPQWHLAVRPLEFTLGGRTGAFHTYAKVNPGSPMKANSTAGKMKAALAVVLGPKGYDTIDGEDGQPVQRPIPYKITELVGQRARFERRTLTFGKNKAGETMKAEQVLIAIAPYVEPGSVAGNQGAAWSDEDVDVALSIVDGKTRTQARTAAAKSGASATVKNGLVGGALIDHLLEQDLIEQREDGTYAILVLA